MNARKYINYINNNEAEMFLYKPIGADGVNGTDFVNELKWLESQGVSKIKVRINSPGGSVFEGYSIFSAIINSTVEVETYIDGIAASIAGIIAMAGKKRYIVDYGQLMIHDPYFNGSKLTEKDRRAIQSMKDSLVKIFSNNTLLNETDISDYMAKETWFSADDAKDFGFVDEVITTERKVTLNEASTAYSLYELTNQFLKPNTPNMDKLQNHFGLDTKSTQEEVLNKITALETEKGQKETELTEANAKLTEKETEITNLKKEIAKSHVKNAISQGKFKADKEAELIVLAENNLDSFLTLCGAVSDKPLDITKEIQNKSEDKENRANWTIRDWETKDEKGLAKMLETNPAAYNKLFNEFYK